MSRNQTFLYENDSATRVARSLYHIVEDIHDKLASCTHPDHLVEVSVRRTTLEEIDPD